MHTKSIICNDPYCLICGTNYHLQRHHIFPGSRRQLSEKYGLWVYLCGRHHTMGDFSAHRDTEFSQRLKEQGQLAWEERYGTRDDFIKEFGKSWVED